MTPAQPTARDVPGAAWPDMLDSLQAAYAELNETQFELEHRVQELDETRELFEQVVESMSEGLFLLDRTGGVLRVNQAATELLNVTPDAARGRQLAELWRDCPFPTTPWQLLERAPEGVVTGLDVRVPGHEPRYASVSCGLVRDASARISGLLVVARDVTERRRQEQVQRFLADVGAVLARSLSHRRILREVAHVCVPALADWCVVYAQGHEGVARVASAHAEHAGRRALARLEEDFLTDPGWSPALLAALETGRAQLHPAEPPSVRRPGEEPVHRILLDGLGGTSTLAVPLTARGRTLGAICCVRTDPELPHDERDAALAEELARRAGLVIDNARLHELEQGSRAAAEEAAARLQRVQRVTDAALAHLDLDGLLDELLERITAALAADTAAILLWDDDREVLVPRAVHGIGDLDETITVPAGAGYAGRIALERRHLVAEDVDLTGDPAAVLLGEGIRSLLGAPLLLEGRLVGVLHVGSARRRRFTDQDVALLRVVGDRAALAIENARLYERERDVAVTLQRSLLPHRLPVLPGFVVSARYLPGSAGVEVGGDWYDVIPLPGGRLGVVVGDVVGRGIRAAATMGQLRTALRTYAFEGYAPARALERLNDLVEGLEEGLFATVAYLVVDPEAASVRYACAGHLPPLVVSPDGAVAWLDGGRSAPLGVRSQRSTPRPEAVAPLPLDHSLLLYTDGLVERRTASIDCGLQRLEDALKTAPPELDALVDHALDALFPAGEPRGDDVALLALRPVTPGPAPLQLRLRAHPGSLARMRQELDAWLADAGVLPDRRQDLVLACDELCANAVEHPVRPTLRFFEVEGELTGDEVRLRIRDFGRWRPARRRRNRGFGLGIVERLVDEVHADATEAGTVVRVRARLAGPGGASDED